MWLVATRLSGADLEHFHHPLRQKSANMKQVETLPRAHKRLHTEQV